MKNKTPIKTPIKIKKCTEKLADAPVRHHLVHLFWQLAPAFTRWAESHMEQKNLTPQRLRLLIPLKENGAMAMSALRDELGVTATNITALVDALEKDGFVKRKPHKTDRRSTMIELTAKAESEWDQNCSQFRDQVSEIFLDFPVKEQEEFKKLLEKMRNALVKENILKEV